MTLTEALANAELNAEHRHLPYVVLLSGGDYSCLSLRAWRRFGWILALYSAVYLVRVDVGELGPVTVVAHYTEGMEATWAGVTA